MTPIIVPRVYCDTSLIGGCFDEEFRDASTRFFELASEGLFKLVLSTITEDEILRAPQSVKTRYDELATAAELVEPTAAAQELQSAYLQHAILSPRWETDALHVALATVARCDMIVSWNFAHIVQYDKIRKYNAVNVLYGYNAVAIHSPLEVISLD